MFESECLHGMQYEATAAAILLAGLFVTFLLEYIAHRFIVRRNTLSSNGNDGDGGSPRPEKMAANSVITPGHDIHAATGYERANSAVNVVMMEAGVIFHSICKTNQVRALG